MPLWSLFAFVLIGSLAILAEFFIPAFGIVGIAGFTTVIVGVVLGFSGHPDPWGVILLLTALIVTPTVVIGGFKRFPKSFFGRRMILATDQGSVPDEARDVEVGSEGEAITPLHPTGLALIGEKRKSVVTRGEFLDKGTELEVVAVEGARIVVRRKDNGS